MCCLTQPLDFGYFYGDYMKKCPKCSKKKEKEKFGKDKTRPKNLTSWCKECRNEKARELRKTNKYKKWNREHKKEKRKDINVRIADNYRSRLSSFIKRGKRDKSLFLLGCSFEDLKRHLESQFTEGMNWDNYGEWHIDHIIPCSSYDFSKVDQQAECFNYKNLQPLWAAENIRKSNKIF